MSQVDPILDDLKGLAIQSRKKARADFMLKYVLATREGGLGFYNKTEGTRTEEKKRLIKDAGELYDMVQKDCGLSDEDK